MALDSAALAVKALAAVVENGGRKAIVTLTVGDAYDPATGKTQRADTQVTDVDCSPVFPEGGGRTGRPADNAPRDGGVTYVPAQGLTFQPAQGQRWTIDGTDYMAEGVEFFSAGGVGQLYVVQLGVGAWVTQAP